MNPGAHQRHQTPPLTRLQAFALALGAAALGVAQAYLWGRNFLGWWH